METDSQPVNASTSMQVIYSKHGVVKAELDLAHKTVIVHWKALYHGDIIMECCNAQCAQVEKGLARIIIVNSLDAKGAPPQECQQWFQDSLFPRFGRAGLAAIITVVPSSAVTRLASSQWSTTGEMFCFDMVEVDSLQAALKLAQSY